MIERDDQREPAAVDEEMLADVIERVTCRLESGEPIDPGDDIPRLPAQASRLRSLLPTIRDLLDLGRSHAAAGGRIAKGPEPTVIQAAPTRCSS